MKLKDLIDKLNKMNPETVICTTRIEVQECERELEELYDFRGIATKVKMKLKHKVNIELSLYPEPFDDYEVLIEEEGSDE